MSRAPSPTSFPARKLLASAALLAACAWFLCFLNGVRPVSEWLFTQLALIWAYDIYLTLACASFGFVFVERVGGRSNLPFLEKIALALPCGLVAFVVGMYVGGFCGWYGRTFALVLPLVLFVSGAGRLVEASHDYLRREGRARPPSPLHALALGFGISALGLVYLGLLTPDAVNYDAAWNHLVIAQDYARARRIVPLPGDWVKNVPHLGSIVNTWAFLVPGLKPAPVRWMQALHNEFTTFLWSLLAITVAVRRIAERPSARAAWPALFLFPSILVYDGNMGAAADHYLAVFSVPVLLTGLYFLESTTWRRGILLGWLAGGALLTKLHAVYLLIPLALALCVKLVRLACARLQQPNDPRLRWAIQAAVVAGLTAGGLLALHFGKNAVFYKNPFYPMAQGSFASEPTLPDAQLQMDYIFGDWHYHPPRELSERLISAVKMIFTFSFVPHYSFMGDVPTFGSLYTLLLPLVLFLKRARRLRFAVAITLAALFTWANTFWVDRSLQTFMPTLATVTGALIVRGWEQGLLLRVPLALLIGLQVVWGGDYFFSGHKRIENSMALIRSGMEGRAHERFAEYRREYRALGASLPKKALVMLHNSHGMLGIDRPVLLDWAGYQAVFDYRLYKTPRDLHHRLEQLGVSHVVFLPGARQAPTLQEEVIFGAYATLNSQKTRRFGHLHVFPVSAEPAPLARPLKVLVLSAADYESGLYPVEALASNRELPPELQQKAGPELPASRAEDALLLLDKADAVITGDVKRMDKAVRAALSEHFQWIPTHPHLTVYLRKVQGVGDATATGIAVKGGS